MYDAELVSKVLSLEISRDRRDAIVVGIDARFVVLIAIESLTGTAPFAAGACQRFAIHSPSRLFGSAPPVGERYRMRLTGPAPLWNLTVIRDR